MRISTIVSCACALVLLLVLAQSCQTSRAASEEQAEGSPVVTDTPNEQSRISPSMEVGTKSTPTPSACPRLPGNLARLAVVGPGTPVAYPPDILVENGKVRVVIRTSADNRYLREMYDVEVLFRIEGGRLAAARVPASQLCPLANDSRVSAVSADEPVRYGPPGIYP